MSAIDLSNLDLSNQEHVQALLDLAQKGQGVDAALAKANRTADLTALAADAGIPYATQAAKNFLAQYEGEQDADKLREAAIAYGIFSAEGGTNARNDEAAEQQASRDAVVGGQAPTEQETEEPGLAGIKAFHESMKRGTPLKQASAEVTNRIIDAACDKVGANGAVIPADQRVIFRGWPEGYVQPAHNGD